MSRIQIKDEQHDRLVREVWDIINALPQREAIVEGDARHWVEDVVGRYGDLAKWHAIRAGGFGGSQIGALIRNFHGLRADHGQSARDIVAGALLRQVPQEPNEHMRRGIAMEASHREWFLRKYDACRDEEGLRILSKGTGPRPWMRYSPDELAFMVNPAGDVGEVQRWLGDYKSPSEVEQNDRVSFQYVAQLHMGRLVCEHNGVLVDGMILSQFDWKNWTLKDDIIEHNPEIDDLIVQAGDHYWAYVLRGELPPYVRKQKVENAKELAARIEEDAYRLARIKSMTLLLEKEATRLRERICEKLADCRLGSATLVAADSLRITATEVFDHDKVSALVPPAVLERVPKKKSAVARYDVDKLVARVRQTLAPGESMGQFCAPDKLDTDVLYEELSKAGLDADALVTEQLRMTATPVVVQEVERFLKREFPDFFEASDDKVDSDRTGQFESRHVPRLQCA